MTVVGQNRKSSMRANVFRYLPNNGHRQDTSTAVSTREASDPQDERLIFGTGWTVEVGYDETGPALPILRLVLLLA